MRVAERRAGGGFGTPRTLSGATGVRPVVALNARGDRAVAWLERTGVRVRIAPAGRPWGPAETVMRKYAVEVANVSDSARIGTVIVVSGDGTAASLDDVAAGPAGRLAVAWAESGTLGPARTFVALRTNAGTFGAPAELTPPGQVGLAGSRVAFSPLTGQAVVVRGYLADGKPAFAAAASEPIAR